MKQEHKVESLTTCISELQQQIQVQRLELEDAHQEYVEPRREQVRLPEEPVMKHFETQIRSIHENQTQELQERVSCMKDSRISGNSIEVQWNNFHTFPVNKKLFQVCVLC